MKTENQALCMCSLTDNSNPAAKFYLRQQGKKGEGTISNHHIT